MTASESTPAGQDEISRQFDVSRETLDRLAIYVELLARWNEKVNLVAPSTIASVWRRHVLDSLQLLTFAPVNAARWTDLGTGAGLPGIVVAIAAHSERPDLRINLIESDRRKCAFLTAAARETGITVDILPRRIEEIEASDADVISARALAPLDRLLALSAPHLKANGVCIFPKGRRVADELTDARKRWHIECDQIPSLSDPEGTVLLIRKAKRHLDS